MMLKLNCEGVELRLNLYDNQRLSMMVAGASRMGKTFFCSLLGATLINKGYNLFLIDLGDKWSLNDKSRLCDSGACIQHFATDDIVICFPSKNDLLCSAQYVASALGFRSINAASIIKNAFDRLIRKNPEGFTYREFIKNINGGDDKDEWGRKVSNRLSGLSTIPNVSFCIDDGIANRFCGKSIIFDLEMLDDLQVQFFSSLILYNLFCIQRSQTRKKIMNRSFVIIDEFQNLNCAQDSVVGLCLTEGQKYSLFLVLATQFIQDKFADSVIKQFKQSGYRFYFRLTEEEAAEISRQVAYDTYTRRVYYKRLSSLPRGECLMLGEHFVRNGKEISERPRFVKVTCEKECYI